MKHKVIKTIRLRINHNYVPKEIRVATNKIKLKQLPPRQRKIWLKEMKALCQPKQ